jgi:hypothetical protein
MEDQFKLHTAFLLLEEHQVVHLFRLQEVLELILTSMLEELVFKVHLQDHMDHQVVYLEERVVSHSEES